MNLNAIPITLNEKKGQYFQINDTGIDAIFYSANGFPLGAYSEFIKQLTTKYKVTCLSPRACWPQIGNPPLQTNWEIYADDLIAFTERQFQVPIAVIGHSQGATAAIIAASKRPDLFKSLIVIEPASVCTSLSYVVKYTPYFIKKHFQPFKSAIKKQDVWPSREDFYRFHRNHRAYRRFPDNVLKDYTEYGLKPLENGNFKLSFSPKWEASNYALAPSIWKYLKKVTLPIHVIAGKPSLFFSSEIRLKWRKVSANSFFTIDPQFGHLFPLEAPEICADLIKSN
ncbi:MAG: alpha/beta hydrolase [Bacteroidales bacterium]|nr:alpha/beta hydrolase [Bacteroidales bacterium]